MALYDYQYWQSQISLSKDFLRTFKESGRMVQEIYRDECNDDNTQGLGSVVKKYNMFWANIGLMKSALYGNPPEAMVRREFDDPNDDVGRVASNIMQRLLQVTPTGRGSDMYNAFTHAIDDRLLPGMGQVWLRYDAKVQNFPMPDMPQIKIPIVQDEDVLCDWVHWEDFFYQPCRVWEECDWVSRRVWMSKEKFQARFPTLTTEPSYKVPREGFVMENAGALEGNDALKRAEVFEIWCKTTRKIHWIADGVDHVLDERPDKLNIPGFYPCPRPLMANTTTNKFLAKADYTMAQDQYSQLNVLNARIALLTEACKAVGVYNKSNEGIQRLLNQGVENQLIPVDNWALFAEAGGLKGSMDMLPIDVIIMVIDKLKEQRLDVIQQIYELTGLSDIMRGITSPRETLGAQKLKAQYSSSRLQLQQTSVAIFVAQAMGLKAWIISKHWQPQTIIRKSLIMHTSDAEYAEQAVALIKDSFELMYRVHISNTQMSIPDYNAEKSERIEFISAMGQFVGQATQVLTTTPEAAPFFIKMLQWAAASFAATGEAESILDSFAKQLEEKLKQPPPEPTPEQQAALEKTQSEADENRATAEEKRAKIQAMGVEGQGEMAMAEAEAQANVDQAEMDMANTQAKTEGNLAVQQAKTEGALVVELTKAEAAERRSENAIEEQLVKALTTPEKKDGQT